ncbi:MAG: GNAT family N-acetyltransferase [Chloroflexi bacterium]|nr:GNAT family N-acetyltransferase [Chloroflexota bacterium]
MDETNIFIGDHIRLTEIDPKKDAEVEAQWTQDLSYARLRKKNPVRPLAPTEVRKDLDEKLKESDEGRRSFFYAMRDCLEEDSLLGFMYITEIEWKNGQGFLRLLFKNDETTALYIAEGLHLALRYVFDELNLYHICMEVYDCALLHIQAIENAKFSLEARLREITYITDAYHDRLIYGLLAEEWRISQGAER